MKNYLRVLLAAALILALTVGAAALDLTQTGSLSLTVATEQHAASKPEVVAYRVAEGAIQNHNLVFVSLVGADYDFNNLTTADVEALAAIDVTGLESYTVTGDEQGNVKFDDLPIGMYLVKLQNGGNFSMTSFVAPVPVGGSGGWDFSVEAAPKVSYYTPPYNPPTEELPDPEVPKDQPEEELEEIEDEDVPLAELSDTGLLQWPIAVLIAGGLALIVVGVVVDRRARR